MKIKKIWEKLLSYLKKEKEEFRKIIQDPKTQLVIKRKTSDTITKVIRFVLLFGLCFVILFPTIQQISMAIRAPEDANNPAVIWIPETFSLMNVEIAMAAMHFGKALVNTLRVSAISMILQVLSTALAGYAFSRLRFKGSNIIFIGVIITIITPPQALSLAQFLYFKSLGLLTKETSLYLMSGLGMGIRSGIFIYIFRQFFRGLPKELEESAQIDGAGVFRTFWNVMLPNARGAMVTVALFAFVWQWNDSYYASLFNLGSADNPLLTMRLLNTAENVYQALNYSGAIDIIGPDIWANPLYQALIANVSALLMMLPLLIMYLFVQKQFVESIERTGIVG